MRILLLCLALVSQYSSANFDWSDYSTLLSKYVSNEEKQGIHSNLVDYQKLAQDPLYPTLLEKLAIFDSTALVGNEKLAFYLNAYNLLAIKMVIDHKPKKSIRDIGSWFNPVWQKPAGVLAGKVISLDTIEHKILRKMKEPRIHFALVCASLSCPDLRTEAYDSERIEAQLDEQTKAFLANPEKGIKTDGKKVYVSKIFDWFAEDFSPKKNTKTILKFIAQYNIEVGRYSDFETLDYNWHLNKK